MNVDKQVDYWRIGSDQDWKVAVDLINREEHRHGLFLLHLAMEKLLKALVCRVTKEFPPRTHNLLTLRESAELELSLDWLELLGRINALCLLGRYPDDPMETIPKPVARQYITEAEKVRQWLLQKLSGS
ncbi:MAG: HEPN domain-containing protein [Magnetococcus sp. YQC-5]